MGAKVNILLSTYNGEKFLPEQLDSLMKQTYHNMVIYVRDDGSSDKTMGILEKYQKQDGCKKIVILKEEKPVNLGYMESFWTLLRNCGDADFYAFCDQDDVWFPEKVERGVEAMEKERDDIPLLYSSNYVYCDENMKVTGSPVHIHVPVKFKDVLFYTPAYGFTVMINNRLRERALYASSLVDMPHDGWCQKIAASMGMFIYDRTVTAKYRRHSNTVTYANSNKLQLAYKWFMNDILGNGLQEYYRVLRHFFEEYASDLSEEDRTRLEIFMKGRNSLLLYFKRLFWNERLRPSLGGEMALRISFLLNK